MGAFADLPLDSFLGCCRGDWRPRERLAVQRKLAAIGVEGVDGLLRFVYDGSLNEKLENMGEKRFTSETLGAMRSAAVQLSVPLGFSVLDGDSSEEDCGTEDPEDILPGVPTTLRPQFCAVRQPLLQAPAARQASREKPGSCEASGSASASTGLGSGGLHGRLRMTRGNCELLAGDICGDEEAVLRRDIYRGLNQMGVVAAEAKRRNNEVEKCLAEVQSGIDRMTERMQAARLRQGSRYQDPSCRATFGSSSSSISNPSAPIQGMAAPPTPKLSTGRPRPGVQPGTTLPPSASRFAPPPSGQPSTLPRRPDSNNRQRRPSQLRGGNAPAARPAKEARSTRGMESGFSFGGAAATRQQSDGTTESLNRSSDPATKVQEAVRNQLLALRGCPDADKKSVVKRLLVKWHPDRNPESTEVATSIFQYIQQEKERILDI